MPLKAERLAVQFSSWALRNTAARLCLASGPVFQRTHSQNTVLWLMIEEDESRDRLQREAAARGVHFSRLWFADRADRTE